MACPCHRCWFISASISQGCIPPNALVTCWKNFQAAVIEFIAIITFVKEDKTVLFSMVGGIFTVTHVQLTFPGIPNKLWLAFVTLLKGKKPLLYSYQAALPKLPVPSLKGTHDNVS